MIAPEPIDVPEGYTINELLRRDTLKATGKKFKIVWWQGDVITLWFHEQGTQVTDMNVAEFIENTVPA